MRSSNESACAWLARAAVTPLLLASPGEKCPQQHLPASLSLVQDFARLRTFELMFPSVFFPSWKALAK